MKRRRPELLEEHTFGDGRTATTLTRSAAHTAASRLYRFTAGAGLAPLYYAGTVATQHGFVRVDRLGTSVEYQILLDGWLYTRVDHDELLNKRSVTARAGRFAGRVFILHDEWRREQRAFGTLQ